MEQKLLSISKTAEILGVHPNTLREWDREGKLKPVKTCGNHRRYKLSDIEKMCEETQREIESDEIRVAVYCRVSSHDQKHKGDLERQSQRVLAYCAKKQYKVIKSFEEVGSGMKDTRPKLNKVFKLVSEGKIDKVIIEHKDRLTRFNFEFLVQFFKSHGVEIGWVNETLVKSYEEELVEDILSLMPSFSNRIYGKRSAEMRKQKKLQEQEKENENDT